VKLYVPYQGREYVFDDSRLTHSEARLQKRVTGGMTPIAAEEARQGLDPDAWLAVLLIGMRRAGQETDPDEINGDDLDIMAAVWLSRERADEEIAQRKADAAQRADAAATAPGEPAGEPAEVPATT
jgi:hypothetical protein